MRAAAQRPSASRWLFGPGPDLVLGCGLGYAAVFVALCAFGGEIRTGTSPGLIPFLTLLVGAPHYGATLLRVYARRDDRRAYALFAVWATAALAVAFVAATRSAWVGSLLLTTYLTWSPWHYTGQNYGLAVMFLRRRGVALAPLAKRLVHASFALSFLLTFVAMHQARGDAASYAPAFYEGYQVLSLGIPAELAGIAMPVLAIAWSGSLIAAAALLLRRARVRDLAPFALLTLTQSLWFTIPVAARQWQLAQGLEPLSSSHATYYFFYAALGHSVQYCWVTSYYARSAAGWRGLGPWLVRALLAGTAIWTIPPLLFAPDWLGRLPFDAGLGALVASAVNLHHFVLDGAIWKLRDGRIARVLIRSEAAPAEAAPPAPIEPRRWRAALPALGWAVGLASLGVVLVAAFESEFGLRRAFAAGDVARIRTAARRLDWLGRESAQHHVQLGRLLASRGDPAGAIRAYRTSLDVQPTAAAWAAIGELLERAGQLDAADEALREALALAPDASVLAYRRGRLALARGDPAQARALLHRALELEPDRKLYRLALERAEQALTRPASTGAQPGD